ncbi:hypothetical protein [Mucilaginibacter sp. OK098]|uniref:hypothetical protein n=1 Tax=Mucilaginibacter sp. OK098 TaxID=1855297 RepID=UPI00091D92FD|nr:hypothetical protein [Mucilaginibacter sp. OK098]SHN16880.1 hypothetical protein SAMN05216524_10659 [Mucilaginibacter sp. OK098]
MITAIDIIFDGKSSIVDLHSLLEALLVKFRDVYFNEPEDVEFTTHEDIINVFKSEVHIDFVVSLNELNMFGIAIPDVFANLGVYNGEIELLLFFDFKDLDFSDYKASIDHLRIWTTEFQNKFKFEYVRCQIDNGNEDEYYFDSHGIGPCYNFLDK